MVVFIRSAAVGSLLMGGTPYATLPRCINTTLFNVQSGDCCGPPRGPYGERRRRFGSGRLVGLVGHG